MSQPKVSGQEIHDDVEHLREERKTSSKKLSLLLCNLCRKKRSSEPVNRGDSANHIRWHHCSGGIYCWHWPLFLSNETEDSRSAGGDVVEERCSRTKQEIRLNRRAAAGTRPVERHTASLTCLPTQKHDILWTENKLLYRWKNDIEMHCHGCCVSSCFWISIRV